MTNLLMKFVFLEIGLREDFDVFIFLAVAGERQL